MFAFALECEVAGFDKSRKTRILKERVMYADYNSKVTGVTYFFYYFTFLVAGMFPEYS